MIYSPLLYDFSRNDSSFKVKGIGSVSIHMFDMKIQNFEQCDVCLKAQEKSNLIVHSQCSRIFFFFFLVKVASLKSLKGLSFF